MTGTSGQVPGCTCHNYDDRPVSFTYNFSPDYSHHGNCPDPDDFLPGDHRCYDDFPSAPDHRDCWNFCGKDNNSKPTTLSNNFAIHSEYQCISNHETDVCSVIQ
ncbi:unnamed protein product [Adineta steineri]|uniref:Uncharacterized protein n=1 Tax=Adineta steineri TaxID=433720 RepID=A0A819RLM7_9BILA|nr:unnamed protein product [Adineta steineri]CAF4048112.1 unnamed protein product [Adineta steineri]